MSWPIGGEGDQEREMRKCSGRSLWCARRLREVYWPAAVGKEMGTAIGLGEK